MSLRPIELEVLNYLQGERLPDNLNVFVNLVDHTWCLFARVPNPCYKLYMSREEYNLLITELMFNGDFSPMSASRTHTYISSPEELLKPATVSVGTPRFSMPIIKRNKWGNIVSVETVKLTHKTVTKYVLYDEDGEFINIFDNHDYQCVAMYPPNIQIFPIEVQVPCE